MAGLRWTTTPADAWGALAGNYRQRIEAGIVAIANSFAPQIESWMKDNRPWQDRTHEARTKLYTEVHHMVGQMVEIELGGRAPHQIYLEVLNGGRFQIINPALDYWAPRVWQAVVRMLR